MGNFCAGFYPEKLQIYIICTVCLPCTGNNPIQEKGVENSVKGKGLKEHRRIAGYFRHFKTVLLFCLSLIHGFTIQPVNSVVMVCITSIANNCLIQIRITD